MSALVELSSVADSLADLVGWDGSHASVDAALGRILDALPDGVVVVDRLGRVQLANRAAEHLDVHERSPSVRDLWADLWDEVTPFDLPGLELDEQPFAVRAATGERFDDEVQFFRGGELAAGRWVAGSARPLTNARGAIVGGVLVLRDVSEQRAAQRALMASESRFRRLAEGLDDVFWILSPVGDRFVYLSPAFSTVFGLPARAVYEAPERWTDGVHPEDRERVERVRAGLSEGIGYDEIYRVLRPDGSLRWVRDRARPMMDAQDSVYRVTGLATDVTDFIETQFELVAKSEALARSNVELEQFARVASHDLQEPLRTVAGFARLLAEHHVDQLDEAGRECVQLVRDGALRAQRLIRDLLEFSRVRADESRFGPVPLAGVMAAVLADHAALLEHFGAKVELPSQLPVVRGDASLLERLFGNLIGNAAKYGGETPIIRISVHETPSELRIKVEDDGPGIPGRALERIFDPFHRLHPEDTDRPGSGMGLAIARRIAECHGGRLGVESSVGLGSCFEVCIPF